MTSLRCVAVWAVCLLGLCSPLVAVPRPCCLPPVWEGQLSSMMGQVKNGQANSYMSAGSIHVDMTNKRFASYQMVETQGRQVNVTVVELVPQNVMYIIVPAIKSCLKQPAGAINNCIPSNAQYIRAQVLGGAAQSSSLEVDEWGVHATTGMDVHARTLVTQDKCIPVFQSMYGDVSNTQVMRSDNFYDTHEGISDKSVFDVPDYCKNSPLVVMDRNVLSLISHHRARRALFK